MRGGEIEPEPFDESGEVFEIPYADLGSRFSFR
jgi:hypothetical protein